MDAENTPVLAHGISVDRLKSLLDDPKSSVLLIDCRPFLSFNRAHIRSAHNVYCPPILHRRYGHNVPIDSILGCAASRRNLIEGRYSTVVVYDDSTLFGDGTVIDDLAKSSKTSSSSHNLLLVLHSLAVVLSEQINGTNLCYLDGGFDCFSRVYQELVKSELIARPVSGSLPRHSFSGLHAASGGSNHLHCGPNCNKQGSLQHKCSKARFQRIDVVDTIRCHSSNDRGDPIEIISGLYLGNSYHASQEDRLVRLGIFALLNVAELSNAGSPLPRASSDSFCHMNLPIADSATSDISCNFPQAIEFIENVRSSGGKVLVHCLAGISRSPTICIAYLMYSHSLSLDQAYDLVKQRRRLISPNLNFMRQLFEYEQVLIPRRQQAVVDVECAKCESLPPPPLLPSVKSSASADGSTSFQPLVPSITKLGHVEDRNACISGFVPNASSRKRPCPDSLSFSIPCSGKPLKSVPYTPCTKRAIFTFDFPSVSAMASSPTVSHSPLCSPT